VFELIIFNKNKIFFSRSPDYGKAIKAAENIFELLDRIPTIDKGSNIGDIIVRENRKYRQKMILCSFYLA
jgi:hypothetical protein